MKTIFSAIAISAALAAPAMAQDHSSHAGHGAAPSASTATPAASNAAAAVMTAGEVTRVDARTGKLTIRHEEIKNLGMPPMTMVFGLKDSAQAASYKPGDKVLFHVEDNNGALTITHIQPVS